MAQLRIDFQGRGKVETFSRARIQAMGDGIQLTLRIGGQVRALGQVLTQQAIGILVGATLPRGMRIGKEDLDRESLGQLLVLGHLFAPIVGQRFPQRGGHLSELLGEASVGTGGIRAVHSGQQHQPCGPFHQGTHSRAIASAFQWSPSQWPGTMRVATSAGRSARGVMLGSWPRRSVPRARGRRALRA